MPGPRVADVAREEGRVRAPELLRHQDLDRPAEQLGEHFPVKTFQLIQFLRKIGLEILLERGVVGVGRVAQETLEFFAQNVVSTPAD